jgi:O-antigen ligase
MENTRKYILISLIAIFCLSLFKPGEEEGIYSWLIRPEYMINLLKIITIFALATIFIYLLLAFYKSKKIGIPKPNFSMAMIITLYIFFFFCLQMISFLNDEQTFITFLARIILIILFFIITVFYINRSINNSYDFLVPIIVAGAAFLFVNTTFFFYDKEAVWPNHIHSRMIGTTEHPNFFALICSTLLISIFEALRTKIQLIKNIKINKLLLIILAVISIFSLYFSGSRTGVLLVAFYFILLAVFLPKGFFNKTISLFLIFVSLIILMQSLDQLTNIENVRITSTVNNRTEAWTDMFNIFLQNPIFGVGLKHVGYSESSYLWSLAATGFIGSIFFYSLVLLLIIYSLKILANDKQKSPALILLPLLFAAISEGFLLDSLSFPLFVFLYCALTLTVVESKL